MLFCSYYRIYKEKTRMEKFNYNRDMKIEYLEVKRIVTESGCENSELIFRNMPRQVVLFGTEKYLKIKKGGNIIFDFGTELQGGVIMTLPEIAAGTHMRIVFGESVSEAMSTIGEKNATNDHSVRDITIPVTSWQTFRYGNTGFRFVKLEAVDNDITIANIQAVLEYRNAEYRGEFCCSDELLNKIWSVGAYTVHLNMQEYLWDGVKRDRIVWVGDMHPEVSTILTVFGDNDVIKNSLDFISKYTPADKWMNGMPSYNLWWLKIQYDYFMWSGNFEYLKSKKAYICGICEHLLSKINADGTHNVGEMFVEWNACETEYEKAGFQAMLKIGLDAAADLLKLLSCGELAEKCTAAAAAVKEKVYPYSGNKQVAAMVSLADMGDANEISGSILKPGGAEGLSAFWGFYTLKALAKSGDTAQALDIIKGYWGKMLEMGATSFWEDFDVKWAENASRIDEAVADGKIDIHGDYGKHCYKGLRHSLCHGWASGPTAFLSQQVLGISIVEAGCKKVRIKPNLGNLRWAKGKFPTPYGEIYVEHTVTNGKVETKFSAPDEVEVSAD